MKNNDPTPRQTSSTDWYLLGQSELSMDAASDSLLRSWLFQILAPFNPPTDLANRIQASLQETISQYLASHDLSQIELRIYILKEVRTDHSMNSNWGFFKLEKKDIHAEAKKNARQVIEYYLYFE